MNEELVCPKCGGRYLNYLNYCFICGTVVSPILRRRESELELPEVLEGEVLEEDIVRDYEAGMSTRQLKRKYHVGSDTLYEILRRHEVKLRGSPIPKAPSSKEKVEHAQTTRNEGS